MKQLVLIELNEISFEELGKYFQNGDYPNFRRLVSGPKATTTSEVDYINIEPWIQWVSAHTGQGYGEHQVFRLGDIVGRNAVKQIYEELEVDGIRVAAMSPMNCENRLKAPAYFVPDPWTQTASSGGRWARMLHYLITQTVNDNAAGRISFRSIIYLLLLFVRFASFKNYRHYLKILFEVRKKRWLKPLFLDLFISDVHLGLNKLKKPMFSSVFFNAGAHLQHHYFLSSKYYDGKLSNPSWYVPNGVDPLEDMLSYYDIILGQYLDLPNTEYILATGLSQVPYTHEKYYWRPIKHEVFLERLGVRFSSVVPRMTRDFLLGFDTLIDQEEALQKLRNVKCRGVALFGDIDVRELELFVTLTYPYSIEDGLVVNVEGVDIDLASDLAFVAVKNGMHSPKGYVFYSKGVARESVPSEFPVAKLFNMVSDYFRPSAI